MRIEKVAESYGVEDRPLARRAVPLPVPVEHLRAPAVVAVVVRRQVGVVQFADAKGQVAVRLEDLRQALPVGADALLAEVVGEAVDARDVRPASRHEAVPAGPAQRHLDVGPVEDHGLLRQRVEVRREHLVRAVCAAAG